MVTHRKTAGHARPEPDEDVLQRHQRQGEACEGCKDPPCPEPPHAPISRLMMMASSAPVPC
jgi:hypothetical protein